MIIVKLMGGMGNQMFQYSLGRALAHQLNQECLLDLSFFDLNHTGAVRTYDLKKFNITLETITSAESLDKIITFTEIASLRSFSKIKNKVKQYIDSGYNVLLDGYFQKNEYVEEVADIISEEFTLKDSLPTNLEKIINHIRSVDSVCIHVRRGDYVQCETTNRYHGFHGADYIKAALPHITRRVENPIFFVFSDDIEWCKNNLNLDYSITYVDKNYNWENDAQYHEIMKNCKHFIIPNSSYSWWAAKLSANKNKIVVTPKKMVSRFRCQEVERLKARRLG